MILEFTDKDRQYLITSIDAYIRQTGIANAALGLELVKKLQMLSNGDTSEDK